MYGQYYMYTLYCTMHAVVIHLFVEEVRNVIVVFAEFKWVGLLC